jgi:hypothetical protein
MNGVKVGKYKLRRGSLAYKIYELRFVIAAVGCLLLFYALAVLFIAI